MLIEIRLKKDTEVASKKKPLISPKGWTRVDSGAARYGDVRAGRSTGDWVGADVTTTGALVGAEVTMGALLGTDVSGDDAKMHVTDATALQPPRWFPGPALGGQSSLLLQTSPRCSGFVFESHSLGQSAAVSHVDRASFEQVPVEVLVVDDVSVGDVFVVGSGAGA